MLSVIKSNGDLEEFSQEKILRSIQRAGIPQDMQQEVIAHVTKKLYDHIPTSEIYHHITEFLGQLPNPFAKTKYGLKQAIMSLGPTGYPFEDFIASILQFQGYKTTVRNIVRGTCISHEIDVIAQKDTKKIMVEAKFHNVPGIKTNVHVALYTKARFDDVKETNHFTDAWLVTNTKITSDAITYATCRNMTIISWSHPKDRGLRDLIEASGLIPITALTTISSFQKQQLLQNNVVLCKNICENPKTLDILTMSDKDRQKILEESQFACNISSFPKTSHSANKAQEIQPVLAS